MKKILGLDLGSSSIGWAVVNDHENTIDILAAGSRIIPLSIEDAKEFTHGNDMSKNMKRTQKRTQRKGYDRYQQRRAKLTQQLLELGMFPEEELLHAPQQTLWKLRADAVSKQISITELGRVLYHINQKRGYRSSKCELVSTDKKQTEYVAAVNNRYDELKARGMTIGECFYSELCADGAFRCKDRVYPRKAYEEEYDTIMACQQKFYPQLLTDDIISSIRNRVIFYQRNLKSCKHLVAMCDFEKRPCVVNDKTILVGPKVAPRTSPLFQVCKIWESINNLVIKNRYGEELYIDLEQKRAIFDFMNNNEKLKLANLYKILNISKSDGWWGGKAIGNGLQGNTTLVKLRKALEPLSNAEELLKFNLEERDKTVDVETGEIIRIVSDSFESEPLYRLWHIVYSIKDKDDLRNTLKTRFGIEEETVVDNLFAIDFVNAGYGNKSSRAMRRILPYLQEGKMYSEACSAAGFRHSESLTTAEIAARPLAEKLKQLQKNELRQPVVEKILNQMINVVNALMDEYGHFDEIRVELARELKQSKDERSDTYKRNNKNQLENDEIAKRIAEYGLISTRSRIQKYKMWQESEHLCFYCGQPVDATDFLNGYGVEVEHIIPKSLFFDDSFSNKVCACRKCNKAKNNQTAYDYMKGKSDADFQDYIDRVTDYFKKGKISKTKYERLLTSADKIPTDFIDRQLRESQYISVKAKEILTSVCRTVTATSGGVTDFLRHIWGYDEILHNLNFERYKDVGLTAINVVEHQGSTYEQERIKNWSKRIDHRHHAIDAITIACTKQGYIQRINNLQTLKDIKFAPIEQQGECQRERHSMLERYVAEQIHPSTAEVTEATAQILVSFKAGKKVTTPGKRYIYRGGKRILAQGGLQIPRGALSEESVYGRIDRYEKNKKGNIVVKKEYVIRYPVESLKASDVKSIVDGRVRRALEARLAESDKNEKNPFKDLDNHPIYLDKEQRLPVRHVRCFTGLSAVVPVSHDENGRDIGFVKPDNNHHVAIYINREGKRIEHVVTFWNAVERKKYGLPVIITNPELAWNTIENKNLPDDFLNSLPMPDWTFELSLQQNEMFILGMDEDDYCQAMDTADSKTLSKYLYRVQKVAKRDYFFRLHIETQVDDNYDDVKNESLSQKMKKMVRIRSFGALEAQNPHKVTVNLLGEIVKK